MKYIAVLIENSPKTALVSFYSTNDDTYILIARCHPLTPSEIEICSHRCENQGTKKLHNWILPNWLIPYKTDFEGWKSQIKDRMREISESINLNGLISEHLQGIKANKTPPLPNIGNLWPSLPCG